MELDAFAGKQVSAGEPVTAQGWNELVNAIANVVSYLKSTAGKSLRVKLTGDAVLADARVAAVAEGGDVIDAARPAPGETEFTLRGLPPGSYTIHAECVGCTPVSQVVLVPAAEPVLLLLKSAGPRMPLLFGEPLSTAVSRLKTDAIVLARVVDITGREVPPANPGDFANTLVLAQLPSAGTPVPPGVTVQLVVSAKLEVEETIEMPSLSGLTLAEVQRVLAELGLQLGTVKTLKEIPRDPLPLPTPTPTSKPLPGETPPINPRPGGEVA